MVNKLKAVLTKKDKLAPSIILASILPKGDFRFTPGQHIVVHIPVKDSFEDRYFSLASPPQQNKEIELIIKMVKDGLASSFFEKLNVGDEFEFSGPMGNFGSLHSGRSAFFFASGTGLAPFRSIIHYKDQNGGFDKNTYLIFGVSDPNEAVLQTEFNALAAKHERFKYTVLQNPDPINYIQSFLGCTDCGIEADFYLCGGPQFINGLKEKLLAHGVPKNAIYHE